MCLFIHPKYSHKYEALRDIKVYKYLAVNECGDYLSPYMKTPWRKGTKRCVPDIGVGVDYSNYGYCSVERGLHAFFTLAKGIGLPRLIENDIVRVEMIIPKGALFFIGDRGDIVSTQLAWYSNRAAVAKPLTLKELP